MGCVHLELLFSNILHDTRMSTEESCYTADCSCIELQSNQFGSSSFAVCTTNHIWSIPKINHFPISESRMICDTWCMLPSELYHPSPTPLTHTHHSHSHPDHSPFTQAPHSTPSITLTSSGFAVRQSEDHQTGKHQPSQICVLQEATAHPPGDSQRSVPLF